MGGNPLAKESPFKFLPMDIVMMHVAEGHEVGVLIRAPFAMKVDMVDFQELAALRRVATFDAPSTLLAGMFISGQYFVVDGIRNVAVVLFQLV